MPSTFDTQKLGYHELVPDQLVIEMDLNDNTWIGELFADHLRILSRNVIDPPGSPAEGDVYFFPSGATGTAEWATLTGPLLIGYKNGWQYCAVPKDGFVGWIVEEGVLARFDPVEDDWLVIDGAHEVGVEYRLAKVSLVTGKTLYRKLLIIVTVPNTAGASSSVSHGVSLIGVGAGRYLKIDGWMSDGSSVRSLNQVTVSVSATQITITPTVAGLGSFTAMVEITYEKG